MLLKTSWSLYNHMKSLHELKSVHTIAMTANHIERVPVTSSHWIPKNLLESLRITQNHQKSVKSLEASKI